MEPIVEIAQLRSPYSDLKALHQAFCHHRRAPSKPLNGSLALGLQRSLMKGFKYRRGRKLKPGVFKFKLRNFEQQPRSGDSVGGGSVYRVFEITGTLGPWKDAPVMPNKQPPVRCPSHCCTKGLSRSPSPPAKAIDPSLPSRGFVSSLSPCHSCQPSAAARKGQSYCR